MDFSLYFNGLLYICIYIFCFLIEIKQLKLESEIGAMLLHVIWILSKHMYGDFKTLF